MARAHTLREKGNVDIVQGETEDFKIESEDDEATNGEIEDDGSVDEPSSGSKAPRISFSVIKARSGCTFSPSKVHAATATMVTIQEHGVVKACKMGARATVFLTAILEYLAAELCEVTGTAACQSSCSRVEAVHVNRGIRNDQDLKVLMSKVRRHIKQTGYEQGRREKAAAAKKAEMKPDQEAIADAPAGLDAKMKPDQKAIADAPAGLDLIEK